MSPKPRSKDYANLQIQVPTTGAKPLIKEVSETQSGFFFPASFTRADQPQMLATYGSIILANGDICSVGNWVLVASDGSESSVCCVEEIVSWAPGHQAPSVAQGVLLRIGALGNFLDPYHMPAVTVTNERAFLPPSVCSFVHPLAANADRLLSRIYGVQ